MDIHIHSYWTIAISLIFAYIFYNIYLKDKKKEAKSTISGIKYLTIVLLIWAASGLFSIIYYDWFETADNGMVKISYYFLTTVLSIATSAFILLAIPSIQIEKRSSREIFKKDKKNVLLYAVSILLGTVAIALLIIDDASDLSPNVLTNSNEFFKQPIYFVSILDLLFVFIVIWELIITMMQAFRERDMNFMIPVSWLLIVFIFISQVLQILPAFISELNVLSNYSIIQHFSLLIYRTLLIALFILLSYSWELRKNKAYTERIRIREENVIVEKEKVIKSLTNRVNRYKTKLNDLKNEQKNGQNNKDRKINMTRDDLEKLTEREKEVFECLAQDISYKDIGMELHIARETVISNVRSIEKKLGIKGKENLTNAARSVFPQEINNEHFLS